MNYLSHHHIAALLEPEAPAAFFVGNVLPDLLAVDGGGVRLRAAHLAPAPDAGDPLVRGVALHLAADRHFHGAPEFVAETAAVGSLLRAAPFASPPPRAFFFAHVFVELALDAVLVRRDPSLADDFYARFAAADLDAAARTAETLVGRSLPELEGTLRRFAGWRYLFDYATDDGLANALHRIGRRAGIEAFLTGYDRATLAGVFGAFMPRAAQVGPALWGRAAGMTPPADVVQ
jgi:hypothetical protein